MLRIKFIHQWNQRGQALVILLFYMIIAILITTTAVAVIVSNSLSVTRTEEAIHALEMAEAGAENGLVRLLRDTNYAGETMTIDGGVVIITVTGTDTKTMTSVGTVGMFSRTVAVGVTITNGVLAVVSWAEQ